MLDPQIGERRGIHYRVAPVVRADHCDMLHHMGL